MSEVCVFPLTNSITLKKISIPYHIFEHRYRVMVNDAIEKGLDIAVLSPASDGNYQDRICIAGFPTILNVHDDGRMDIVITGKFKCRLKKCKQAGPYLLYNYDKLQDDAQLDSNEIEDLELLRELVWSYVCQQHFLQSQKDLIKKVLDDPETVVSYTNLLLIKDSFSKQKIMELPSLSDQVTELLSLLSPDSIYLGKYMEPIKLK
jgi:Lon protease-like protein